MRRALAALGVLGVIAACSSFDDGKTAGEPIDGGTDHDIATITNDDASPSIDAGPGETCGNAPFGDDFEAIDSTNPAWTQKSVGSVSVMEQPTSVAPPSRVLAIGLTGTKDQRGFLELAHVAPTCAAWTYQLAFRARIASTSPMPGPAPAVVGPMLVTLVPGAPPGPDGFHDRSGVGIVWNGGDVQTKLLDDGCTGAKPTPCGMFPKMPATIASAVNDQWHYYSIVVHLTATAAGPGPFGSVEWTFDHGASTTLPLPIPLTIGPLRTEFGAYLSPATFNGTVELDDVTVTFGP